MLTFWACRRMLTAPPIPPLWHLATHKFSSSGHSLPEKVEIVEVGARDGLQNESTLVPMSVKLELLGRLAKCGIKRLEATSFVSPKWVPQLADHKQLLNQLIRVPGVTYSVLTPNLKGFKGALEAGADEVAVFGAASESFSQKNINCSIAESLERFRDVTDAAAAAGVPVRGYVSCVVGCPYEGAVAPAAVATVAQGLLRLGCWEISLGDTIGCGTPESITKMLEAVLTVVPVERLAIHCHDTQGRALENIRAALQLGVSVVDASVAGLGGCPYARGASGNVATEKVVESLHAWGVDTGVDLPQLRLTADYISGELSRLRAAEADTTKSKL